ncbi:unnamed protein product [Cochlearia groenlandica]
MTKCQVDFCLNWELTSCEITSWEGDELGVGALGSIRARCRRAGEQTSAVSASWGEDERGVGKLESRRARCRRAGEQTSWASKSWTSASWEQTSWTSARWGADDLDVDGAEERTS